MTPDVGRRKGNERVSGADTTPTPVRRERRLRLAEVVAAAGVITALAGGATLIEEFGPGALIVAVAGFAVLVAALLAGLVGAVVVTCRWRRVSAGLRIGLDAFLLKATAVIDGL